MRPIDADAALKALRKCQTYLYDARDPELKIELSSAEAAINNLPTIQPVATDICVGDTISRQAAIDAIVQCTNCGDEDTLRKYVLKHNLDNGWTGGILEALDAVKDLPPAQPEPQEGHWIRTDCGLDVECKCSRCGYKDFVKPRDEYWFKRNYCPHCGARMKGESNEID